MSIVELKSYNDLYNLVYWYLYVAGNEKEIAELIKL